MQAEKLLQDCLESADWATFKDVASDLDVYVTIVNNFKKEMCGGVWFPRKASECSTTRSLGGTRKSGFLRTRSWAFKSGDAVIGVIRDDEVL